MATKVVVLREMDPQDQIDGLLGMGNIKEAQQIFLTKFASKVTIIPLLSDMPIS